MSSLALPPLAQAQIPLDPKPHWITPKEQLNRLNEPYLLIAEAISDLSILISDVEKLVLQYVVDEWVTNWYTAQERLNSLPEKIPPLPEDISQIMNDECPIYAGQIKADKTAYKIKDTHFLSLVPKEFGNLNRLERDILKPYGDRTYSKEKNPLRFRDFFPEACQEHVDVPFPDTHWILMTKGVLPRSKFTTWGQQMELVHSLRKKTVVDYEIPTLQQSFAGITTDMVATGKSRYQARKDQRGRVCHTYTRVKERTQGNHWIIGDLASCGVFVSDDYGFDDEWLGVAVLRKFSGT